MEQEPPHARPRLCSPSRYAEYVSTTYSIHICNRSRLKVLGFGITDASYTCSGTLSAFQILGPSYGSAAVTAAGSLFTNNGFGFIAICFSLFSNTASTSLVGYKAWSV